MTAYTRKEILDEAKNLAKMLASTEEIDRFKKVQAKLNEKTKVQALIKKIKALQKQAVNLQAYDKTASLQREDTESAHLKGEIDAIPDVHEFTQTQTVVNENLQLVSGTHART